MIYRNLSTGRIAPLPWRVRLPDGTTLTDPAQWASNPDALAAANYAVTERDASDDAYDLEQAKAAKLGEIDRAWADRITAGWMVPGEAYALGIDVADVTLLLGAYTLAKDAAALGLPDDVSIIDTAGESHEFTSQTLTPVMLQYGSARATLSGWYASMRQAVAAATTLEEVANIEVT
jgi:hypothetical protein